MSKTQKGRTAVQAGDSRALSLFPSRPVRTQKPPGLTVRLVTNFFAMSIKQKKTIFRYLVDIDSELTSEGTTKVQPKKLGSQLRTQILEKALETWYKRQGQQKDTSYHYVSDLNAATLLTLFKLTETDSKVPEMRVKLDDHDDTFRVRLSHCQQLDLMGLVDYCAGKKHQDVAMIQEHLKAINIILRGRLKEIATNVMCPLTVFPYLPENQVPISPGIILNKGYAAVARVTQNGLALNISNTSSPFYESIMLTEFVQKRYFVKDFSKGLQPRVIDSLKKELITKQIEAMHINYGDKNNPHYRKYRIHEIAGSSQDKFMLVDKATNEPREITIAEYFTKEYKVKLKFPQLPCVVDTRGRKIPLEMCRLVEKQKVNRKLDGNETSETLKVAAMRADVHFNQLKKHVDQLTDAKKPFIDFGLDFEPRPMLVDGRELPSIFMTGASGKNLLTRDGQYDASDRFIKPASVKQWVLTYFVDDRVRRSAGPNVRDAKALEEFLVRAGQDFSSLYCNAARYKGMSVNNVTKINILQAKSEFEMKKELFKYFTYLNTSKIDHSIFLLPDGCPDWIYRYLQFLEGTVKTNRGPNERCTRISCIKFSNFLRKIIQDRAPRPQDRGRMFIGNLLYKYNTKMGGVNFVLGNDNSPFLQDGYIYISLDVCHPAPGDKLIQSVAAAVGMWDVTNSNMSTYTCQRVQKKMRENHSTIEEVGEVGNMVDEILSSYFAKKKKLPTHIIILRDGVSEGQFKIVLEKELVRVKQTIAQKYAKSKPPLLSCFVVQKRHRTRFKRVEAQQTRKGPDYNIQPGTVVDTKVVHPTDHDFYIAPHKAIQGTSQPLHIYTIYDEIKLSQEDAQSIVFKLSHLSPRCNKGTSIPTAVNLADLAAERGKNIVISWNDDNQKVKMSEDERLKKLNQIFKDLGDVNYKSTLYYI